MDKNDIKKILPHRGSMLLIDEAELIDGSSIGKYTVRGDEFFLDGHFPENPVVPGVILCEMMAQSACLLVNSDDKNFTPYYTSLNNVKFIHPVKPGDCVVFKSEIVKQKNIFYFVKSTGHIGDILCVSGELSFALVKGE